MASQPGWPGILGVQEPLRGGRRSRSGSLMMPINGWSSCSDTATASTAPHEADMVCRNLHTQQRWPQSR